MESSLFNVLLFVGTIASIVSLMIGLWKYKRIYQVVNAVLVIALTIFASLSYFRLQAMRETEHSTKERKEIAQQEAARLLHSLPASAEYFRPGDSRGIALASLAFLEQRKDLYPETFKLAKMTVERDIAAAQAKTGQEEERQAMQSVGQAMLQMLRGLAGAEGHGS